MNGTAARFLRLSVSLTGLVTLGWVLTGQAARPAHRGTPLPTDWSHRHLIFSHPATSEQAARVSEDPRYGQQLQRLNHRLVLPAQELAPEASSLPVMNASKRKPLFSKNFRRDWSEDLGTVVTAGTGAGNFPAKFVFESNVANCGNATTPDYVVYSTGLAGSGTQADIVAYDNIYSGCTGTVPSVYWAYNTSGSGSGTVLTSPVLSRDGTQVAFVQTDTVGSAKVVLLRWKAATGTVGGPAAPNSVANGSYVGCTAPCMTTIQLVDPIGPINSDDTTSSIFYDYSGDVAWVGDSHGLLHKFTPFFKGTPAEVTTAPWPVTVSTAIPLTSPVYDHVSASVFVAGVTSGFLYRVDPTLGTVIPSGPLDESSVLVAAPIVDSSNGLVYVFAPADISGGGITPDSAGVYQLPTNFTAASLGTEVQVGTSTIFPAIPNPLYGGDFDSNYFSSISGTGNLYVCGNTGLIPILYQIPVTAGVMGTPVTVATLATAGTPACSPVTDISAPPATAGNAATERLFVSVQNNSRACVGGGCLQNLVDTPWQASTTFAIGQEILVNGSGSSSSKRFTFVATTAGVTSAIQPSWPNSPGAPKVDSGVTWINQGNPDVLPNTWAPGTPYALNTRVIDGNGQVEIVTTAGTSGAAAPGWATTPNTTTNDNGITWNNLGQFSMAALAATGGTSGIIIDNTVTTGTPAGTSQVYFKTLDNQPCGTSGTGGCAVQASQSALQ